MQVQTRPTKAGLRERLTEGTTWPNDCMRGESFELLCWGIEVEHVALLYISKTRNFPTVMPCVESQEKHKHRQNVLRNRWTYRDPISRTIFDIQQQTEFCGWREITPVSDTWKLVWFTEGRSAYLAHHTKHIRYIKNLGWQLVTWCGETQARFSTGRMGAVAIRFSRTPVSIFLPVWRLYKIQWDPLKPKSLLGYIGCSPSFDSLSTKKLVRVFITLISKGAWR